MIAVIALLCAVCIIFALLVIYVMGTFTSNEVSYVLALVAHHPVHLAPAWGIVLNFLFNGVAVTFDIVTACLRAAGAI